MRRWLRRILWGVGAALALVLLLVTAAVIALRTEWGHETVKTQVVKAVNGWLEGEVSVGRLEGALPGQVVLVDVVVRTRAGDEVLRVPRLEATLALEELLDQRVHVRKVVVTQPTVRATQGKDGRWDVASLLPPSKNDQPSAWRILVDEAILHGGVVRLAPQGADAVHLAGVEVALGLDFHDESLAVEVERLAALWLERALPVEVVGRLERDAGGLEADGVRVRVGGSRIAAETVRVDGGAISAALAIDARAAELIRFAPGLPWRGDLVAAGRVEREDAAAPWVFGLDGALAGAPIRIEGRALGPVQAVRLRATQIRPGALWTGADPRGQLDELDARATLVGGEGVARIEARAPDGRAEVNAIVSLPSQRLRWGRVEASAPRIERYAGKLLGGDLAVDLTARGTSADLAVAGTVRGSGVRYQDVRVGKLVASVHLTGLPGQVTGSGAVRADQVTRGKLPLGFVKGQVSFADQARHIELALDTGGGRTPYAVTARAVIDRSDAGTRIRVGAFQVRTRQLLWDGSHAEVTLRPGGEIDLAGVDLQSKAGRIEATGALGRTGDRLDLQVKGLILEELRLALVPDSPEVRGRLDGRVVVVRRNRRLSELRAKVIASQLVWRREAEPIRVDVDLQLLGRDLTGGIAVEGGQTGIIGLDVETRTPVDPLDPAAWAALDEKDVRRIDLRLGKLDLARAGRLLGLETKLTGTVDADVKIGAGLTSLDGKVAARRVQIAEVDAPMDGEVRVTLADGKLDLGGSVTRQGGGSAQLSARMNAPRRLTRIEEWRRLDEDDVHAARVTFQGLTLDSLSAVKQRAPDLGGTLMGTVTLRGKGTDVVTADVRVDGLRDKRYAGTISARLETSLYHDRLVASLTSTTGTQKLIDADVTLGAGLDVLLSGDTTDLERARATGKIRVVALPLELIKRTFSLPVDMKGSLDVNADIGGRLDDPTFDGRLTLAPGGRLQGIVFDKLETTAKVDRSRLVARMKAAQHAGGTLDGEVAVDTKNPRIGTARLTAQRFDLRFLSLLEAKTGFGVRRGLLDAQIRMEGTAEGRKAEGKLLVSGAEVRLSEVVSVLSDARLEVTLDQKGQLAAKLQAKTAGTGSVALEASGSTTGLALNNTKGEFRTRNLTISTGRTKIEVDSQGTFTGLPRDDAYHLYLVTEDGKVRIPQRLGDDKLHETGDLEDVVYVDARGLRKHAEKTKVGPLVVVHLETKRALLLTSEEIRADVRARLAVSVFPSENVIKGQVSIDQGFLELFGRRWNFQGSRAVFNGEVPLNPKLDIRLAHEFRTTTVSIGLGGTLEQPDLKLTSDGGTYDQSQLLGFVLGGSPDDQGPAGDEDVTAQAVDAASGLLFGQIQPILKKIVPVDVVSVKRRTGATEETLITVGKWISSSIFIGYHHRFSEATATDNANEASLEWYFLRKWRFELIFGDRGEGSAEVLWLNRW